MAVFRTFREWLRLKTEAISPNPANPQTMQAQKKAGIAVADKVVDAVKKSGGSKTPEDLIADPTANAELVGGAYKDFAAKNPNSPTPPPIGAFVQQAKDPTQQPGAPTAMMRKK